MNEIVLKEFEGTSSAFIRTLASFPQEQFNDEPWEQGWSAGQVGDHILKAFPDELLNGHTKATERQPDEKKNIGFDLFMNFETKMESPEFILPSNDPINKHDLIHALETRRENVIEAIKSLDLSETCTDFAIPQFGEFTRLEWLYFFIYHVKRHNHQLEKVFKKVTVLS